MSEAGVAMLARQCHERDGRSERTRLKRASRSRAPLPKPFNAHDIEALSRVEIRRSSSTRRLRRSAGPSTTGMMGCGGGIETSRRHGETRFALTSRRFSTSASTRSLSPWCMGAECRALWTWCCRSPRCQLALALLRRPGPAPKTRRARSSFDRRWPGPQPSEVSPPRRLRG